ncbi:MAG TPA: hypothetical protein VK081_09325, partial [Planctomycetota bacterium]|nr:hypothetical protein [Planctomycetota bacterium]
MPTVPCSAGPTAGAYASVALASLIAGVLALDLVGADLRVPLWYENDALYYATVVKAVGEQGWWWSNPRLAMPFGQVLLDFPMPDTLSFAVLRVLEPFAGDAFLRLNLFYLLGFPLTAVTALFALCRIGAARAPAMLASVLYAVLPFRLLRGEAHVMYTAYQAFPLLLPVLVAIGTGQVDARREPGWRRGAYALAACAAVASTGGAYQPFFACLLLAALALWCVVRSGRIAAAGPALALLAFTFLVFVLNLLPSILHRVRHGRSETARRLFYEADLFGLEIASLLLPVADHRIPSFAGARAAYDLTPVGQDGAMMALGILGSAGFVVLLGALLFRRRGSPPDAFDVLAVLNATVVLVATVGGFALLFNLFVSPQLRGFNLAVVPIGMFAFAAVAL